jgi:hypothetical protein
MALGRGTVPAVPLVGRQRVVVAADATEVAGHPPQGIARSTATIASSSRSVRYSS